MTFEDHLRAALREARLSNARSINQVRAAGAGAFTLAQLFNLYGLGVETEAFILIPTSIYFLMSLAFAFGSKVSPTVLALSRFAIPIYDMPTVYVIQVINMETSPNPAQISEFTIALFVCLILLSAYTLSARHIFISVVVAIVLQQLLQDQAQITMGGRLFSPLVFGLAGWICLWAGKNRLKLLETFALANARRMRLQRYFSPGVGEILEEREEDSLALGKDCDLSIIFVDIRGFTALSEKLSSREVVEILNTYHAHMVEVIFRHGGTLDKYLGDGLIAYFNAPVGQPDHANRAVACALDMHKSLSEINEWLNERSYESMALGIGIHTGSAIVGDIGAPHRREFTAIGSAVNIASRLEGMTKVLGSVIVVSKETAEAVKEVEWDELGTHEIRGCREPMALFSPETEP